MYYKLTFLRETATIAYIKNEERLMYNRTSSLLVVVSIMLLILALVLVIGNNRPKANLPTAPSATPTEAPFDLSKWSYECDALGIGRFTWKDTIVLKHAVLNASVSFDRLTDSSGRNDKTLLAFLLIPQGYDIFTRLWITAVGKYDPDLTHFHMSEFSQNYPGGYEEIEKELSSAGIDWKSLYQQLRMEYLYITRDLPKDCKPEIKSTPSVPLPTA